MSDHDWKITVAGHGCFQCTQVCLSRNECSWEIISNHDWKIAVMGHGCFQVWNLEAKFETWNQIWNPSLKLGFQVWFQVWNLTLGFQVWNLEFWSIGNEQSWLENYSHGLWVFSCLKLGSQVWNLESNLESKFETWLPSLVPSLKLETWLPSLVPSLKLGISIMIGKSQSWVVVVFKFETWKPSLFLHPGGDFLHLSIALRDRGSILKSFSCWSKQNKLIASDSLVFCRSVLRFCETAYFAIKIVGKNFCPLTCGFLRVKNLLRWTTWHCIKCASTLRLSSSGSCMWDLSSHFLAFCIFEPLNLLLSPWLPAAPFLQWKNYEKTENMVALQLLKVGQMVEVVS